MRRRLTHTPYFTALVLILTLTLSFIHVPIATSQNSEEIISKLRELQEDVSAPSLPDDAFENTRSAKGQRKALTNKIKAVINQIEAGTYKGAINKLENDLKNTIEAWITEDYEVSLIEKVDEIIKLIKGELPPPPPPLNPEASFFFMPETPLAGDTVTFNASASEDPDGTIVSYTWEFGDETVVTVSDPVTAHIYATYGIYTVSLTVTDNDSLTDTESKPVKVIAPPTASFTYSPLAPLVNEVITFDASGSASNGGEIESYIWNFSDGLTKTGEIVTHAYSTEGIYRVVLNVTDTEGLWDTSTVDITVYAFPVVDFPPEIIGVYRVPEEPNYDEYVRILASVIDIEGEVESVILGYSINSVDWTNQTMAFNQNIGFYTAEIPPQPYNTTVNYKVYASDNIGNWAVSRTYNYTVVDKYMPIVEIEEPTEGSYLRGLVNITVNVQEANLFEAKLAINGKVVCSWHESGKHYFLWNTSSPDYPDSTYTIKLNASDKADNSAEKTLIVTIDNTLPTAVINAPSEGAFLRKTVIIEVTGKDDHFEKIELKINDSLVKTWTTVGNQVYLWNTEVDGIDGTYTIKLIVHDKAGNSDESSVTVIVDNTLPTIRIDEPVEGSYLAGIVDIKVFVQEDNLDKAKLTINGTEVVAWTSSGEHAFSWDTTTYAEGVYFIKLSALDKAGNIGEKTIKVIVDNTAPTALIHAPIEGSYLKSIVFIKITGEDANFDRMELRIGDVLVKTWTASGDKLFPWNTKADGAYKVTLTVYDKANNSKEVFVTVTVDNTPPTIEATTWTPKEPSTDEQVNVTVKVFDPQPGSGIQNVTLWYQNTTMDDWQPIPMSLNDTSGNWTATIPAQSMETTIEFYIEALDNAGNRADEFYEYEVIAPAGIPLAWIVAIILLILAATAAAIYFWRKRRSRETGRNL